MTDFKIPHLPLTLCRRLVTNTPMPELWQQIFVGVLVVVVFVAFVKEWFSAEIVAMGAFVILLISGILVQNGERDDVAVVFGTSAPIIVACMFVMSAALERTGTIEALGGWFGKIAGKSESRVLIVMILIVGPLSAFVNNTPVVVVFMPIILALCRKLDLTASRLLIPLSYAAIAGGTCTIIGTSTNVLASGVAAEYGATSGLPQLREFGMFEVGKLGIIFFTITVVYLYFFGRKLLPDRITLSTLFESEEGKEFLTQAVVSEDSPLVGKLFTETRLPKMRELRVVEVARGGAVVKTQLNKVRFKAGDRVLFKTRAAGVMSLSETDGLELAPKGELGLENVQTASAILMEGIIGPQSSLAGKSLKKLNFRQRYGVLILAVHRRGVNLRERFEDVKLAFGDTLLVEGAPEQMNRLFGEKDFINLSRPRQRPFRRSKAPIAMLALLLFMFLGAFKVLPLVVLALGAVLLTLFTRCLDPQEAYDAIDWKVIFMIYGMLGVGQALQVTGVAENMANAVSGTFGRYGPQVVLAIFYLLAALLTEIISNNAVAILMTKIAIVAAIGLEVDPRPFVVAVMFGSSASFATPIGYQTNTYVYGAGGYKFSDFTRIGVPLAIVLWITASLLIPVIWPLVPLIKP